MMRKVLVPLLAVAGLAIAVISVWPSGPTAAPVPSAALAATAPYQSYVAAAGLIEASSGNIAVGTPVPGILVAIDVQWGDRVEVGDPLFRIDDGDLRAQLPLARAKVGEAAANRAQAEYLLQLADGLHRQQILSEEDFRRRRFAMASASAALATTRAEVQRIEAEIARRTVRAPVAGRVLQMPSRLGEFAESGAGKPAVLILGDDARLSVRVEADEYDAWRIRPGARAQAFVRGNPDLHAPLRFERIEPLLVPKSSLTGGSSERTDTRVLQVLYSFERAALPVYVGQQVDVFIEAEPTPVRTP